MREIIVIGVKLWGSWWRMMAKKRMGLRGVKIV